MDWVGTFAVDPVSAQHHCVLQRVQDDGGNVGASLTTVILNSIQDPEGVAVFSSATHKFNPPPEICCTNFVFEVFGPRGGG